MIGHHKFTVVEEEKEADTHSHDVAFVQPTDHHFPSVCCQSHDKDLVIFKENHLIICGFSCINSGVAHTLNYENTV